MMIPKKINMVFEIICHIAMIILTIFITLDYWINLEPYFKIKLHGILFIIYSACLLIVVLLFKEIAQRKIHSSRNWDACLILTLFMSMPFFFLYFLIKTSPFLPSPKLILTVYIFLSLPPLFVVCIWHYLTRMTRITLDVKLVTFNLFFLILIVIIIEISAQLITVSVKKGPFAINSPDRTYWYFKPNSVWDKRNKILFNSLGFRGPEPSVTRNEVKKILILGDSISFGENFTEDKIFPRIAESMMNENKKLVEVMNASITSFSIEQIKNFYLKKLCNLPHDIVILCFYIDDVNRESRYTKNRRLYTPAWPEWIQDVFYSTFILNSVMEFLGYSDEFFLETRNLSYDAAWSNIFSILNEINQAAQNRGAQFAIFNIPYLEWNGIIMEKDQYQHVKKNEELEKWCRYKGIPYYDTLSMFLKVDIDFFRIDSSDTHLNEMGHKLMAGQLKNFLEKLIND